MMAPEATVTHRSWRCVPSANCSVSSLNTLYVDKPELSAVWDQTGAVHDWLWSTDITTGILFKLKTLHLLSPIEGSFCVALAAQEF